MIHIQERTFVLSTKETTLLLRVNEADKLVCDHYGRKINEKDLQSAAVPVGMTTGRTVIYDMEKSPKISLATIHGEFSAPYKGDYLVPSLDIVSEKGRLYDFLYVSHEVRPLAPMEGYPTPRE
ncbi:MAG: hypothetical protein IJS52_02765, partial [Bacilli bacterium]|nr:hypothetical protein [Bacilli bacterium]